MRPAIRIVEQSPELPTRVCGIMFRCDDEHEMRCIKAIRAREHPRWSSSWSDFRVASRKKGKLREVLAA